MREMVNRLEVALPAERRPRRLRTNPALRRLVRETRLDPGHLDRMGVCTPAFTGQSHVLELDDPGR